MRRSSAACPDHRGGRGGAGRRHGDRARRVYRSDAERERAGRSERRTERPGIRTRVRSRVRSRVTEAVRRVGGLSARPARPRATTERYTGSIKKIKAVDRADRRVRSVRDRTSAFLPKVAFQRVRHPGHRLPRGPRGRQVVPRPAERHRALQAHRVEQGQPDGLRGQSRLLGHQGPDAEPRVPLERRGRPAAPRAPVRQRRRHRQPRRRRHRERSRRTTRPQVLPARGPQHVLHRLEQPR